MPLVDLEGGRQRHREGPDVGVVRAGPEVEAQRRVGRSLGLLASALQRDGHLRLEGKRRAVVGVEVGREVGHRPLVADPLRVDGEVRAVGRVDHEVRAIDVDSDFAHPDRDAADDRRHRFGVRDHVGVELIDLDPDSDDDHAVVIGPGEGRGDRGEAERRALEGPGEVHPADRVEGVGAGAGGDVGGADLRAGGAARRRLLLAAELLRRRRGSRLPGSRRCRAGCRSGRAEA